MRQQLAVAAVMLPPLVTPEWRICRLQTGTDVLQVLLALAFTPATAIPRSTLSGPGFPELDSTSVASLQQVSKPPPGPIGTDHMSEWTAAQAQLRHWLRPPQKTVDLCMAAFETAPSLESLGRVHCPRTPQHALMPDTCALFQDAPAC